jgi:hypothetical protein
LKKLTAAGPPTINPMSKLNGMTKMKKIGTMRMGSQTDLFCRASVMSFFAIVKMIFQFIFHLPVRSPAA